MDNIKEMFITLEKRQTFTEIASRSGVSRNTVFSVRKDPERSTVKTLRKIFQAMGYNLILTIEPLEKIETEKDVL